MKDDKVSHGQEPHTQTPPGHSDGTPRTSRRRFGKAGLAAPVIMTLASRSVWGTTGGCSLSGDIMSGNVSNRHDDYECTTGYGCTPGFWKNNTAPWEGTIASPGDCKEYNDDGVTCKVWNAYDVGTKFADVFGFPPSCVGPEATLMAVLHECKGPGKLDKHATAAVLNAAHPAIAYGATVMQVIEAWQNARTANADDRELLKNVFDSMNNRGCPLNAHGECKEGHMNNEIGECIPVQTSQPKTSGD